MDSWETIRGRGLVCALAVLGWSGGQATADRIPEPPPLVWDCVASGEVDAGAYWEGLWDRDSDAQTSSPPRCSVRLAAEASRPEMMGDVWSKAEGLAGVSADGSGVRASVDGDIIGTAQLGISLHVAGHALVEVAEGYPAGTPLWLNVSADVYQNSLDPLEAVAWSLVISRVGTLDEVLAIVDQDSLSSQIPIVVGQPLGIVFDAYLGWSTSQGYHSLSQGWDIGLAVVPEPTALCVLGLGVLLVRRRRAVR